MKHLSLFEDFSDPGFGLQILNVSPAKMAELKKKSNVVTRNGGVVGIVANELAKKMGKKKPFDAFKKVYKCGNKLAFLKK
jgi:hypothetical protein